MRRLLAVFSFKYNVHSLFQNAFISASRIMTISLLFIIRTFQIVYLMMHRKKAQESL